ncbi:hypothetical protein JCM19296_2257 [Nonlabens ulvanivorans]|uniref:FAD-dependent urate hydroxylase HpyO/Asp monooxygenase CreE-like FAD/NAD(P)-binding domain-containing protein n=1 Tax=Nonlabens ulvanivorans TaxID=906888 RepID=A0A081DCL4_NONUL|nr:FAD/NAD(P)-binding protein [Nonlabens ulvanivorans]GAK76660.1 hypothetical protein JCM19296_2257 [Nonlabens ulvanivorans]
MYSLAIVGLGPRGLYALESLFVTLSRKRHKIIPKVALIESQTEIGCGSAWSIHQPDANTINISDRDLVELPERETINGDGYLITAFPSFIDWVRDNYNHELDDNKDTYFERNVMGRYLHQRARTIIDPLIKQDVVTLINARATSLKIVDKITEIDFENDQHQSIHVQHTLLTTGHLPEEKSKQDEEFSHHANQFSDVFFIHNPYSKKAYNQYNQLHHVAIKGMGLSMIDIVHLCIARLNGEFKTSNQEPFLSYDHHSKSDLKIYPFSLDGLPVIPKPLGKKVDQHFNVEKEVIDNLKKKLQILQESPQYLKIENILAPIADIIQIIYKRLEYDDSNKDIHSLILDWLMGKKVDSSIWLDKELSTVDYLKQACLMACGDQPFTLDYTIGQVWRQLQPTLYSIFTHSNLPPDLQSEFIKIDEFTKRYSYGPPVERVLQLIALSECGILDFGLASNPTIIEDKNGWILKNKSTEKKVHAMVNGVLASPNVKKINDPLINSLFSSNYLEPFHKELGIKTNENGCALTETESTIDIAVLGRNAKGSVYGVDAILECFSTETEKWSNHFVNTHLLE